MKYLLLALIRLYWLIPSKSRNRCLFKEFCSRYVLRLISTNEFKEGIKALKFRLRTCRPTYKLLDIGGQSVLLCQNGHLIDADKMANWLKIKEQEVNLEKL